MSCALCAEMSGTPSARLPEGHPLVLSRSGEAMSERAYQQRMKEIVAEAGTYQAIPNICEISAESVYRDADPDEFLAARNQGKTGAAVM